MKLEYGKRYVTRSSGTTGPLELGHLEEYPFKGTIVGAAGGSLTLTWTQNGRQSVDPVADVPYDIVAEYCESVCEEPAPELRKLVWVPGRTYKMRNGGLVFVTEVGELGSYPIVGFRIYPGEDAEKFSNTWAITGKRHLGNVSSTFDIVDYAYEVGDDE